MRTDRRGGENVRRLSEPIPFEMGLQIPCVLVPKRRRKVLFGQVRRHLGEIFHALARQKECQILEGHLLPDHVHMCIAIPPSIRWLR